LVFLKSLLYMDKMLAFGFSKVSIVHGKDASRWFFIKCLFYMERMQAVGFSKVSNIHGKDASCWFF
jgi:hypothetical protein